MIPVERNKPQNTAVKTLKLNIMEEDKIENHDDQISIRKWALSFAVRCDYDSNNPDPDKIIKVARQFEKYIKGED